MHFLGSNATEICWRAGLSNPALKRGLSLGSHYGSLQRTPNTLAECEGTLLHGRKWKKGGQELGRRGYGGGERICGDEIGTWEEKEMRG